MDIETFLQMRPTWAYQPCLYIVKQMFPGNNAYRCGAAGTQLFKQADPVYGADRTGSLTGLLGRMTMYKNYWLPLKGRLYAALRIRSNLSPVQGNVWASTLSGPNTTSIVGTRRSCSSERRRCTPSWTSEACGGKRTRRTSCSLHARVSKS